MWADGFRGDWQVYPGAGYVVAFANPHGSTGYGQALTEQISGDWGGRVFEDLMRVTDELEKLPYVDTKRMGAMGWSYGGYMMNWFQGHTDRFKCLADMMGIFDTRSFYYATEELWFPEWDMGGPYWLNPEGYEKDNPANHVDKWQTPMLVIHGGLDYRIPLEQGIATFTALQRKGIPSQFLYYPDENHWVLSPANSIQWHETVLAWMARWTGE
jgi:dipeptidyl aminopeptidase/acylaminoacyl peptidase